MPRPDELTAIRKANDLDLAEEAAWTKIELEGWTPTPPLLFALIALYREQLIDRYGHDRMIS